jgi:hypothetical protein
MWYHYLCSEESPCCVYDYSSECCPDVILTYWALVLGSEAEIGSVLPFCMLPSLFPPQYEWVHIVVSWGLLP